MKVEWSAFEQNRLAVTTSQNFGFLGTGKLSILELENRGIKENISWYSKDALFDITWSQSNENQLVGCLGDGSINLWDRREIKQPIHSWFEHKAEAYSVDWNYKACF